MCNGKSTTIVVQITNNRMLIAYGLILGKSRQNRIVISVSPPLTPKGTGRYQTIIRGHIQQARSRRAKRKANRVSVPLLDFYSGLAFLGKAGNNKPKS